MMYNMYNKLLFFCGKDKANERLGHLMVSDQSRPRPHATPEKLQVRCRPLRWVGRRSPALPDAKRSGHYFTPVLNAGGGNDLVESAHACCHCWRRDSTTRTLVASYDIISTRMILF